MYYTLYLLVHDCGRTYIGITTDVTRRLRQHNGILSGGAKATTRYGPGWKIVAHLSPFDKSTALRIERNVKKSRGLVSRLKRFEEKQQENPDLILEKYIS